MKIAGGVNDTRRVEQHEGVKLGLRHLLLHLRYFLFVPIGLQTIVAVPTRRGWNVPGRADHMGPAECSRRPCQRCGPGAAQKFPSWLCFRQSISPWKAAERPASAGRIVKASPSVNKIGASRGNSVRGLFREPTQRPAVKPRVTFEKANECYFFRRGVCVEKAFHFPDRDLAGALGREAVDAGADAGERDGLDLVFFGE